MSRYLRARIEGGWFFFTVTLADRSSDLLVREIERLRKAYAAAQRRHLSRRLRSACCPTTCTPSGRCLVMMRTFPAAGAWSSMISPAVCRRIPAEARAKSASGRKEYGSDAIGSTSCAMRPILSATSTIFISIRSNMDSSPRCPTGLTAHSIVTSRADFCRSIGAAIRGKQRAVISANRGRVGYSKGQRPVPTAVARPCKNSVGTAASRPYTSLRNV
jgi:hypothetical protein